MRIRIYISLAVALALFYAIPAYSQMLYPVVQNKLWGFADSLGNNVIRPQYDRAGEMENGFAKATQGNSLFIIYNPARIIKLEGCTRFDRIAGSNYYKVQKDHQWWLADKNGKLLSDEGFDRIWTASLGIGKFFFTTKGNTGLLDSSGSVLFKSNYFTLKFLNGIFYSVTTISGALLVVNENGINVVPDSFKSVQLINRNFSVFMGFSIDGSKTLFDGKGNIIMRGKHVKWDTLSNDFLLFRPEKKSKIYDAKREVFIDSLSGTFGSSALPGTITIYEYGKPAQIFHRTLGFLPNINGIQYYQPGKITIIQTNGFYGLIDENYKIILEPAYSKIVRMNDYNFMVQDSGFYYKVFDGYKRRLEQELWYTDWSIHSGYFKAYIPGNAMDYFELNDSGFIRSRTTYFNVQRVNVLYRSENNAIWAWNRRVPIANNTFVTNSNRSSPWFQGNIVNIRNNGNFTRYGLRRFDSKTNKFEVYRTPIYSQVIVLPDSNLSYAGMQSAKNKKIPVLYRSETPSPGDFTILEESTGNPLIPFCDYIDLNDFRDKTSMNFRAYRNGKMYLFSKTKFIPVFSAFYIAKPQYGCRAICVSGTLASENFSDGLRDLNDDDLLYGLGLKGNWRYPNYSIKNGDWRLLFPDGKFIKPEIAGSGKIIFMSEFKNGFAIVKLNNQKFGVIDSSGNTFIPAEYDIIHFSPDISGHFYCGTKFYKWGLANQYGDILLQPSFTRILPAGDAFYGMNGDSTFLFNTYGDVTQLERKSKPVNFENETGFIRCKGGFKITNDLGNSTLDPIFQNSKCFHNGYAAVNKAGRWGLVNENGQTAVKFRYSNAKSYQYTAGIFEKNIRWIFVNNEGEKIHGPTRADAYAEVSPHVFAYYSGKRSKYALYNEHGKKLSGFSFSECPILFNDYILGCRSSKVNFYNPEGKKIATLKSLPKYKSGQFTLQNAQKTKIKELESFSVLKFSPAQLRAFGMDSPWNELLVPLGIRREVTMQKNYLFEAYRNDVYQIQTINGASFVNGNNENVMTEYFSSAEAMNKELSICKRKNGKYGLLNTQGFWVLPPEYGHLQRLSDSVFAFCVNYEYDIINENGTKINDEKIDGIQFRNQMLCIRHQNKVGYYSPQKTMVWEMSE